MSIEDIKGKYNTEKKEVQKLIADFADSLIKYEDGEKFVLDVPKELLSEKSKAEILKEQKQALDRATTLLKVAKRFFEQQKDSPYTLDLLSATEIYDGAECDGYCLVDDIENWFLENGLEEEMNREEELSEGNKRMDDIELEEGER